jgi:YidC/Oxa1 family membrane protein insertase
VTQSVFSVVQQWFITGWGSLGDWIPGLPELPEHRRLGYRPPRNLDDVVVMSGAAVPARTGIMGWFDKRMAEAQAQQTARTSTAKGGGTTGTAGSTDGDEARPAKGARPVKKSSPAAKAKRSTAQTGSAGSTPDDGAVAEPEPISVNGSRPRAVPRKSRASRPPDES